MNVAILNGNKFSHVAEQVAHFPVLFKTTALIFFRRQVAIYSTFPVMLQAKETILQVVYYHRRITKNQARRTLDPGGDAIFVDNIHAERKAAGVEFPSRRSPIPAGAMDIKVESCSFV